MQVITGNGIHLYQLLTLKQAILLQQKGIRMSRGVSPLYIGKKQTGQKTYETVLAALEIKIQEAAAKVGPNDIKNT